MKLMYVTVWKSSFVGVVDVCSIEYSSQGVWVAEVPPTKRVDEFPPCQPMCLAQ